MVQVSSYPSVAGVANGNLGCTAALPRREVCCTADANQLPGCWRRVAGHASLEFGAEILDRAAQGLTAPGAWAQKVLPGPRKSGPGRAGPRCPPGSALATLQRTQDLHAPGQAVAARGTPAAGLAGENSSMLCSSETMLTVWSTARARPVPIRRADLADAVGIHRRHPGASGIRKPVPAPPGCQHFKLVAITHATGVVLEQLAGAGCRTAAPTVPGFFTLPEKPISLVPMSSLPGRARVLYQLHAVGDDRRDVAQGLDVVDAGRLAPYAGRRRGRAAWSAGWRDGLPGS